MANSILNPTAVSRAALVVLHQKLNFIGTINRQYDDQFANEGAKIGSSLKVRLPNEYSVRTGKILDAQDTSESSTTLTVQSQAGVDVNFSTAEMTMDIQDFSKRILEPAMSKLAAHIENDALSMYKDVETEVSDVGATLTLAGVLNAQKRLALQLAPMDSRNLLLSPKSNVDLVSAASQLYNDRTKVGDQYRKGLIGNDFFGFDTVFQNTLLPIHTTGTDDGTGDYLTDIAAGENNGTAGAINVDTGAGTFKRGDIVFIEGVYDVHPESKATLANLKQFVVTQDCTPGAGGGDLFISPSIVATGAKKNVASAPADGKKILKVESDESTVIAASADYQIDLAYHKDAFCFATADLVMPGGVDFAARETVDGIRLRIVRQYDINNDNMPCRIDIIYGYKCIRPTLATRIGFN